MAHRAGGGKGVRWGPRPAAPPQVEAARPPAARRRLPGYPAAMDLYAATTVVATGEDAFTWDVPPDWEHLRGAFGGLVVGAAIRAGEAALADPARPLRALTAELMVPAQPGPVTIRLRRLRAGRSVTVVAADLNQADNPVAHVVLTFGRPRDDARWQHGVPPRLPPWSEVASFEVPSPPGPRFIRYFDVRPVTGLPFSGGGAAEVVGWVVPRSPGAGRGAPYLAACIDAYWPGFIVGDREPRAAATLTYTLQLTGVAVPHDEPLAYRARSLAAGDGYVPELRELWTADGQLLAVNPQTLVLGG